MGRGKTLTMPERAQVDLMVKLNMSISLMSPRIHFSRTLNDCYMSDPVAYGTSKSTGSARKCYLTLISDRFLNMDVKSSILVLSLCPRL
uniref:HTH_Tnp_Tc3_1 domain-containing protein n=1 Tax=Caenorhabditis japonica TaxID=281687 RepID=A0A8R1EPV3_CAEJA